jgi:hypothetical protein
MLQDLTTLEETAERFYKTPEFIWNLSLSYPDHLRPELGETGKVVFSSEQRQIIGKIIKLREDGLIQSEIFEKLDEPKRLSAPAAFSDCISCTNTEKCKNNFKILSDQIKFMYRQICLLQSELEAMQRLGDGNVESFERIFPAA